MNLSKGIWYMLAASFTFTLMKVFVKMVPHVPAIEIIFFRSVISLVLSVALLRNQRINIWGNNKKLLVMRGGAGAIALILFFTLLQRIPLATAATLSYLAPIFTAIMGIFLVGEKVRAMQWLFFAVSFSGILIIQGFDPRIETGHLILGITSSFFMGVAYNVIRKIKLTEHPLVIIFYFPLIVLPISAIWSSMVWVQPKGWDWGALILVGITTQVAQFFMTKAYQTEELNKVSIINYIGIIYSLSFGFILFNETYNWITYGGMALVLLGVVANVLWKK